MRSGTSSRAVFFVVFAAIAAPQLFAFTVAPARLYLDLPAGAHDEQTITIRDIDPATASVSIDSFELDRDGTPHRGVVRERSGVEWIAISRDPAGMARLMIDVPRSAEGSYWSAVVVTATGSAVNGRTVAARIVVPVVVTVAGSEVRKVSIDALTAERADGEVIVKALVSNRGNSAARAPIVVALEQDGIEIATAGDTEVLLLPGYERAVQFRFRIEERDATAAVMSLRYGSGAAEVATSTCAVRGGRQKNA